MHYIFFKTTVNWANNNYMYYFFAHRGLEPGYFVGTSLFCLGNLRTDSFSVTADWLKLIIYFYLILSTLK